jgi:hypothetical protein
MANNSYIQDVGTGKLHITSDGTGVSIDKGTSELMATFDIDGAVTLYHDNAAKLATTATGISVTGNATFADGGKAVFGASSDLEIYHDGTNSYVSEVGTGDLRLGAANIRIGDNISGASYIYATQNAEVTLYHNNSPKLATTATGINVTGTTVTDGLASVGPVSAQNFAASTYMSLSRAQGTEASPTAVANGQTIGSFYFSGYTSANVYRTGALIEASTDGGISGDELPTKLTFSTTADGANTPTERMRINKNGFVGIGGATDPSYQLDVKKAGTTFARVIATTDNTRAGYLAQAHTSGGADVNMSMGVFGDASQGEISMATNHPLLLYTNNDPAKGVEIQVDGDLNIKDGNLVVANGHGIDFSATAGTGTSELLDDYEEGTFTPSYVGSTSGTAVHSVQIGTYLKVGNLCTVSQNNISGGVLIAGLPFTAANKSSYGWINATNGTWAWNDRPRTVYVSNNATTIGMWDDNTNTIISGDMVAGGGNNIEFQVSYQTQ